MIKNLNIVERNFLKKIVHDEVVQTRKINQKKQSQLIKALSFYENFQSEIAQSLSDFYGSRRQNKDKQKAIEITALKYELQGLKSLTKNCYQKELQHSLKLLQKKCSQMRKIILRIKNEKRIQKQLNLNANNESFSKSSDNFNKQFSCQQQQKKQIKQLQQRKVQLLDRLDLQKRCLKVENKDLSQSCQIPKQLLLKKDQASVINVKKAQEEREHLNRLKQDFMSQLVQLSTLRQQRKQSYKQYQTQLQQIIVTFEQQQSTLFQFQKREKEMELILGRQIQGNINLKNKLLLKKAQTRKIRSLNQLLSQDIKNISKLTSQLHCVLRGKAVLNSGHQ